MHTPSLSTHIQHKSTMFSLVRLHTHASTYISRFIFVPLLTLHHLLRGRTTALSTFPVFAHRLDDIIDAEKHAGGLG